MTIDADLPTLLLNLVATRFRGSDLVLAGDPCPLKADETFRNNSEIGVLLIIQSF